MYCFGNLLHWPRFYVLLSMKDNNTKDVMNNVTLPEISIEKLKHCNTTLKRQFDLTYPLGNQKSFFIGVSDYVQIVLKSDYLDALVLTFILNDRNDLIKEIDEVSKKSVAETKSTYKKLLATIKEQKIDIPAVNSEIQQYNDYLEGRTYISGSGNFATHQIDYVRDIIMSLKYNGHEDIANRYSIIGERPEIITGWKISKSEPEVERMLRKLKDQQDISVWSAWEELWWVYATIQDKDSIWESMAGSKNTWKRFNFAGLIGEMKRILESKEPEPNRYHFFELDKFKRHLTRVNNKIESEIDELLSALNKKQAKAQIDSDVENDLNNFYFDDKTFKLKSADGSIKSINLATTKIRGTDTYFLLLALTSILKITGRREQGLWLVAEISMSDITKWLKKELNIDKGSNWIKNTKSNLIKVIPNEYVDSYIKISNFDRKKGCYKFELKMSK